MKLIKYATMLSTVNIVERKYKLLGLDIPTVSCVFENNEIMVLKIPPRKCWISRGEYKNIKTEYGVFYKNSGEVQFEVKE